MAQALAPNRRAVLRGSAAALLASTAAASAKPESGPDAELVRVCHDFAEAEWRNWWRYIVAPANLADAQDREPDWPTLAWIEATPATTPAGWHAKALAYAAWWREAYDDVEAERDASTSLLAALLRDMVAPARAEILARCAAEYGPLPEGYTADARWVGKGPGDAVAAAPPHPDAEMLAACVAFGRAEEEVARLEGIDDAPDAVFESALDVLHAAIVRVSDLRARTAAGVRAKAGVCRALLAMDEPDVTAARIGGATRRHDVLAWSTLNDMAEFQV
jgi:hypothetical protein